MFIYQMIAIVQAYINHRTGQEVQISTYNLDMTKLEQAYQFAINWFNNNEGTITQIEW